MLIHYQYHIENHSKLKHKCPECGWMFSTFNCVKVHCCQQHGKVLTKADRPVVVRPSCPTCSRTLVDDKAYQEHMKYHANMRYECICGWMYEEFNCLQGHLRSRHKIKAIKKNERDFLVKGLGGRREEEESLELYSCSRCGRQLKKWHLAEHTSNHSKMKYKCQEESCGWLYETYDNLVTHYESRHCKSIRCHPEKEYLISKVYVAEVKEEYVKKCPLCSRPFGEKYLEAHVAKHDDLTQKCKETGCGWTYRRFAELRNHYSKEHQLLITKDHRDTIYILGRSSSGLRKSQNKCPICSRKFKGSFNHLHVKEHDKMKYKCSEPECGWMFRYFQKLERHYRNHHFYLAKNAEVCLGEGLIESIRPDQKFVECPYCGCRLSGWKIFRSHVHRHNTMKSMYKCPIITCGWMYGKEESLKSHYLKMHSSTSVDTSKENVECKECGRRLSQEVFDKHLQCFDKMKYKCPECPMVFDRYLPLKRHVVNKHGKVLSFKEEEYINRRHAFGDKDTNAKRHKKLKGKSTGTDIANVRNQSFRMKADKDTRKNITKQASHVLRYAKTAQNSACSICGRHFSCFSVRRKHEEQHEQMRYKCTDSSCGWMFKQFHLLQWHYSFAHNGNPMRNKLCEKDLEEKVRELNKSPSETSVRCAVSPDVMGIDDSVTEIEKMMLVEFSCESGNAAERDVADPKLQDTIALPNECQSDDSFLENLPHSSGDRHVDDFILPQENQVQVKIERASICCNICNYTFDKIESLQHHICNNFLSQSSAIEDSQNSQLNANQLSDVGNCHSQSNINEYRADTQDRISEVEMKPDVGYVSDNNTLNCMYQNEDQWQQCPIHCNTGQCCQSQSLPRHRKATLLAN